MDCEAKYRGMKSKPMTFDEFDDAAGLVMLVTNLYFHLDEADRLLSYCAEHYSEYCDSEIQYAAADLKKIVKILKSKDEHFTDSVYKKYFTKD